MAPNDSGAHVHAALVPVHHRPLPDVGAVGVRGAAGEDPLRGQQVPHQPGGVHCREDERRDGEGGGEARAGRAGVKKTGDATAKEAVERVLDVLVDNRCLTYETCVAWARLHFQDYFHNRVAQLIFTFPEDTVTSQVRKT
eukprot:1181167-Prorocentrum_minimum.AAC.3